MKRPKPAAYIAWVPFQRRAASLAERADLELAYFPPLSSRRLFKVVGYPFQAIKTCAFIIRRRPLEIWIQIPPSPLAPFLLLVRWMLRLRCLVVADCHNSAFRAPWVHFPGYARALKRFDLVLVHNEEVRSQALALGVPVDRLRVLEDPPSSGAPAPSLVPAGEQRYIVVPCSFSEDEPTCDLLAAARLLPDVDFKVTGNLAKARARGYLDNVPANVTFTGYLGVPEYNSLLAHASAILGLTSFEGIQLSVASEALGFEKPLILSSTKILRKLFGDAALFCENTADDIAHAVDCALADYTRRSSLSRDLKKRRETDWGETFSALSESVFAERVRRRP